MTRVQIVVHKLPYHLGESTRARRRQKKSPSPSWTAEVLILLTELTQPIWKQQEWDSFVVTLCPLSCTRFTSWPYKVGQLILDICFLVHTLESCDKRTTFGSLLLLTLYSFHFADEDVSAAISSFLNSDSPTAKVKQRFQKQSNKVITGPLLLLYCDKDDLQPRRLCLWAAAQVVLSNIFFRLDWF